MSEAAIAPAPAAARSSGGLLGDAAVVVWNDVASEGREAFYAWHDKEHIPERLALPGFRRGRRFRIAPHPPCRAASPGERGEAWGEGGHSPEWLTMYEADDVSALVSPEYLARLNAPTPATTRTLPYFRNTARAVCRRVHSVGSSTGGFMLALRANVAPRDEEAMRRQVREHAFVQAMAMTSVLACHLYAADERASNVDTAESRTRAFDVPAWIVLIEASTAESAQRAREIIQSAALHRVGVRVRDAAVYALEICRLAAPAG